MDEKILMPEERVNFKVEKNSRGYNWEVTMLNFPTDSEGLQRAFEAHDAVVKMLRARYDE